MAHERSRRKRRLARLSVVAALAALVLAGCAETPTAGWSDPQRSPIDAIELAPASTVITVSVELPPGYEPADEFVQRATLRSGAEERIDVQSGLDRAFQLSPADGTEEGEIELILGFCESDVKEICYVDTTTLPVRLVDWDGAGTNEPPGRAAGDAGAVVYRPEAPK